MMNQTISTPNRLITEVGALEAASQPFEDSSLLKTLDDGRIELWVSNTKKINYDSLYDIMGEANRKIAGA